ncbi:AMP-dependent synthetase/ligase [Streptomyces beijiangensis]|uniref:Long-chain fatty acid--CoA ligase n=1 Tax=Streptomyces beijiangensis TaxID=163361 RepID=A0A939F9C3_9ACTN|nr:AMP-dependent synthetase/ligase [Streptomyces beijiangensis]MBO0512865.1 long-chain fatty acid--CoA ligase [Streptomyces beijiangensis]
MTPTESTESTESRRPETLALFTEWTGERYGGLPALSSRGGEDRMSYTELRDAVRECARRLISTGVRPGDRIGILSETRPEWTLTHFAAFAVGAVVVPVYPTAGEEEVAWVLGDSGAVAVVCEDAAQADRVDALRDRLPALRDVILLTGICAPSGPADETSLAELLSRAAAVKPSDLCSIVYTSGTTGPPKGCRLTHGNLGAVLEANLDVVEGGPGDRTYLYLPLAHLLAQLIEFTTLLYGGELAYFGGRIEDVVKELAEVRPTHLPSVPRLFEKVHSVVQSLAESQEGGRTRFEEAVRIGVLAADGELPPELRDAHAAYDQSLYSLVRGVFGGRLRSAVTGGAPISPATMDLLRACGIPVYEGYGMTESAGVIALNHPGASRPGTVGRPIAGCEVRTAADGEVLARGPMIFPGYYANPTASSAALDGDGWLHTGDLGAVDSDGYLTITGRKKDLIITSAGKNLSPAEVESAIERSPYVAHAVMVGDRRPYPVALITVDAEAAAGRQDVRELVQEAVEAANATVSRPARIRAFAVLDEDFTIASGVLTPTLKVRRAKVLERYAKEIEDLYRSSPSGDTSNPSGGKSSPSRGPLPAP